MTRKNKASSRRNIALFLRIKGRTANSRRGSKANLYPAYTYHMGFDYFIFVKKTAWEQTKTLAPRKDKDLIPFARYRYYRYQDIIIVVVVLSLYARSSARYHSPSRPLAELKIRISPAALPFQRHLPYVYITPIGVEGARSYRSQLLFTLFFLGDMQAKNDFVHQPSYLGVH